MSRMRLKGGIPRAGHAFQMKPPPVSDLKAGHCSDLKSPPAAFRGFEKMLFLFFPPWVSVEARAEKIHFPLATAKAVPLVTG